MSARRDTIFALGFCLMFSFLSIEARSLEESSVKTKRDTNDWWSLLEDIIYDNDSGSDDDADDENILICRNCTVVVQAAPNGTADGSTAAPAAEGPAPGSTVGTPVTPSGSTPGAPPPAPSETPAPATTAAPPAVTPATTTAVAPGPDG
ncbi:UV excision repair protein RAD23 homolog B [Drosophila subpulchrella]|uniref:UV excision repair protein RAD23 homolog B n=1 Tax=Drosophila subpulchrella TaxID=1486046 RepID=UPI0018A19CB9|nr:UV excision repair protein RAD23 homolog B [Drosophila subpulchrella]